MYKNISFYCKIQSLGKYNNTFTFFHRSKLVKGMKQDPYTLCTDGSNDEGLVKLNPLLIRVFDINEDKVMSQLLDKCRSKKMTKKVCLD